MNATSSIFAAAYRVIVVLFVACAVALMAFAGLELWQGVAPGGAQPLRGRSNAIVECIGLLTIAVAALELGQTILEEEVQRSTHLSAPTRVRRFLSRFLIVVIVSLSIECLVATFQAAHQDPRQLPYAAAIGLAAAGMLAAWGVFVKLNTAAEELEPAAMAEVKEEDHKVSEQGELWTACPARPDASGAVRREAGDDPAGALHLADRALAAEARHPIQGGRSGTVGKPG
jgi:hypothetical protein